jgi:large subunit ribosomal protein L9
MMQIILRDDVAALGNAGDVVKVKAGYARNYLIPQGLAVFADSRNVKQLEHERRVAHAKQAKAKGDAQARAQKILAESLTFHREAGEEGKLFGSVTSQDIAAALDEKGLTVDRRRIRLQEPIKVVGDYAVPIRLHAEVEIDVAVSVQPKPV